MWVEGGGGALGDWGRLTIINKGATIGQTTKFIYFLDKFKIFLRIGI